MRKVGSVVALSIGLLFLFHNTLSAQTSDFDQDGVVDNTDLDSDNDGILDVMEMSCSSQFNNDDLTFNGSAIDQFSNSDLTTANSGAWISSYSNETLSLPITMKYVIAQQGGYAMFGLIYSSGTQTVNSWSDDAYKFYIGIDKLYGKTPNGWSPYGLDVQAGDELTWEIDQSGFVTGKLNGSIVTQFQGEVDTYSVAITTYLPQKYSNIEFTDSNSLQCVERDTDADGAPDHLDRDSDGDGCSDALEAGNTSSTLEDYYFTTQSGTSSDSNSDGLADELDADMNGIPDVDHSDTPAYDPSMANCSDNDLDGVADEVDLDDDNDGIYDLDEMDCSSGVGFADLQFGGSIINAHGADFLNVESNQGWRSSYSTTAVSLPIVLEFRYTATGNGMIGLIPEGSLQNENSWNDGAYKYYLNGGTLYGRANGAWELYGTTVNNGDILSLEIDENGIVTGKQNGAIIWEFQGQAENYYVATSTASVQQYFDILYTHGDSQECIARDTDFDGLPDHFDIDSDGDGCLDVSEAGFTDEDEDGILDGTTVDQTGLVVGAIDGYTGTTARVIDPNYFGCDVDLIKHNVNVLSDKVDNTPGDGVCADEDGNCSLRAAIQEANTNSDFSEIRFDVDGELLINSPLPLIMGNVVINGYSAPGYIAGQPSVKLVGAGNNFLELSEAHNTIIQGLDMNGSDDAGFDEYAIILAWSDNVIIRDNSIRNRTRAIHASYSCGLEVYGNDLRDCGEASGDGALYLNNLCPNTSTDLNVRDNLYGPLNANPEGGLQIVNSNDVITSDGSVTGSHIVLDQHMSMNYPIRYVNVNGGMISDIDLSSSGPKAGIGVRIQNCNDIIVQRVGLMNRNIAAHVTGGTGHVISDCDLTNSGASEDYSAIRIENIDNSGPQGISISANQIDPDAHTVLNMISCSDITIGTGVDADIRMDETVYTGHTPFRIQSCDNVHFSELELQRTDQLIGTEGIMAEGGCQGVEVSNCTIQGFASGINLADARNAEVYCNTITWNRNGIWLFTNSSIDHISENTFSCNQVGINNHTGIELISTQDYWGHEGGSQSYDGFGDFIEGEVSIPSWLESAPACASDIDPSVCQAEICDNGVDDDGDGLVDCEDGACTNSPGCETNKATDSIVAKADLHLFPNPSQGQFTIVSDFEEGQLLVFDTRGALVLAQSISTTLTEVDMREVKPGIYFVKAINKGEIQHAQLVVQ